MELGPRTVLQLVMVVIGVVVFALGHRRENETLTLIAIGFFAAAAIIRFVKYGRRDDSTDG
jgi:DMSO reductase anchor subunit